jgi:hypothetical protein
MILVTMVKMDNLQNQLIEEYEKYFQRKLNPAGMTIDEIERAGTDGCLFKVRILFELY